MIILIGYIHLDPSDVNEFVADAQALTSIARAEKACLFYTVAVDDASAGRMLLVEKWQDQESLTSHIKIQEAAFLKKWTSRMKVDILKYDASNERSLLG